MIKINQNIQLIESFFQLKIDKLLVNGVDEKISSFYLFILGFFQENSLYSIFKSTRKLG